MTDQRRPGDHHTASDMNLGRRGDGMCSIQRPSDTVLHSIVHILSPTSPYFATCKKMSFSFRFPPFSFLFSLNFFFLIVLAVVLSLSLLFWMLLFLLLFPYPRRNCVVCLFYLPSLILCFVFCILPRPLPYHMPTLSTFCSS